MRFLTNLIKFFISILFEVLHKSVVGAFFILAFAFLLFIPVAFCYMLYQLGGWGIIIVGVLVLYTIGDELYKL